MSDDAHLLAVMKVTEMPAVLDDTKEHQNALKQEVTRVAAKLAEYLVKTGGQLHRVTMPDGKTGYYGCEIRQWEFIGKYPFWRTIVTYDLKTRVGVPHTDWGFITQCEFAEAVRDGLIGIAHQQAIADRDKAVNLTAELENVW